MNTASGSSSRLEATCMLKATWRQSACRIAILAGSGLLLAACATTPAVEQGRVAVASERAEGKESSLLLLAERLAAAGDHAAAIPLFQSAHKGYDFRTRPLVGLGRSYSALGQYVAAEDAFRQAVERDGKDVSALTGLGATLVRLGRPSDALPYLEQALTRQPENLDAVLAKALAEDMLGLHDAALGTYARGQAFAASDAKLLNNYGLSLALHDDVAGAVRALEQAVRQPQAGATARRNLALAYLLAGNRELAYQMLVIDHDSLGAEQRLSELSAIAALPVNARFAAFLDGTRAQPHDTGAPANRAFDNQAEMADATARRLVGEEAPVVAALPAAEPVVETPADEPKPAPHTPAPHADADLSDFPLLEQEGYALQLAAYRKASQLVAGWEKLRKAYGEIIGHLPPRRTEVDFGERAEGPRGFYYRLNAGPLTSKAEADALCARLLAEGAACWVRPPAADEGRLPAKANALNLEPFMLAGNRVAAATAMATGRTPG